MLNGTTSLGSVATTNVAGNAALNLPLQLAVPLAGYTLPNGAQVAVNLPDATNPASLSVSVTPALKYRQSDTRARSSMVCRVLNNLFKPRAANCSANSFRRSAIA